MPHHHHHLNQNNTHEVPLVGDGKSDSNGAFLQQPGAYYLWQKVSQ